MARVIWSAERGWHDDGRKATVTLDERGRLVIVPEPTREEDLPMPTETSPAAPAASLIPMANGATVTRAALTNVGAGYVRGIVLATLGRDEMVTWEVVREPGADVFHAHWGRYHYRDEDGALADYRDRAARVVAAR
jgi:hypothetical protein